jgi:hypothetical protein
VLLARLDQPKDAVQVKLPEPLLKDVRDTWPASTARSPTAMNARP